MGEDVAATALAGVAVEQVLEAGQQRAPPMAVDGVLERAAVDQEQAQQTGQVLAAPVARDGCTAGAALSLAEGVLRYWVSLTFSSQATDLPSTCSWMARWVMAAVADAPCQCFWPSGIDTTSPRSMR